MIRAVSEGQGLMCLFAFSIFGALLFGMIANGVAAWSARWGWRLGLVMAAVGIVILIVILHDQPVSEWPRAAVRSMILYLPWMFLSLMPMAVAWEKERVLRDRNPHLCKTCGYNLTGNTSGVCPECGTELIIE